MSTKLRSGSATLYAQLAMILRSKITSGEWGEGTEIPPLNELCEQYSVARVTARQAVQMLVDDGLVSSHRGRRTYVSHVPAFSNVKSLFNASGSIENILTEHTVKILDRKSFDTLPEEPFIGIANGPYVLVRKVDCIGTEPYAVSDTYVSKPVFDRIDYASLQSVKLAFLVCRNSKVMVARERMRIAAADYEEANQLDCPISAPVARVERAFCDQHDQVIYYSKLTYGGDRFAVEHDISDIIVELASGSDIKKSN